MEYALLLVFPGMMIFAAMMDLFTMTIPNRISIVLVCGFLIAAPLTGMALTDFGVHLAVGAAVLAVGIALFAFGLVGGGDAKLLAAASLWIGSSDLGQYFVLVAVFGGLLSLIAAAYRKLIIPQWLVRQPWAARLHCSEEGIPYGLALSAAALCVFPSTAWFTSVAIA